MNKIQVVIMKLSILWFMVFSSMLAYMSVRCYSQYLSFEKTILGITMIVINLVLINLSIKSTNLKRVYEIFLFIITVIGLYSINIGNATIIQRFSLLSGFSVKIIYGIICISFAFVVMAMYQYYRKWMRIQKIIERQKNKTGGI